MQESELRKIIQTGYNRDDWRRVLQYLDADRGLIVSYLQPKILSITTKASKDIVKSFLEVGKIKTADGVVLPIFEVVLNDHIQIERNRVSVNDFIKSHIVKDAIKGALATFSYKDNEKTEWRFSFISKNSASEFFAEVEAEETNPRRFTYIFGNKEQHKTAVERFSILHQSNFLLDDFFEAFNVAPVSDNFFELYSRFHKELSSFLNDKPDYRKLFENPDNLDINPEREIRNFVNRLMGRIVFLYFLQKKRWLGATTTQYDDGSLSFLSELFDKETDSQGDFYAEYLCPLFFNALNTPDRPGDKFTLANGEAFCIPFLNGGLFEESQEPVGHRNIKFDAFRFKDLFEFLDSFNFTVYENSPEEHTVAVDPEMLGHIFENLIDYNKDTGTFYTPKEIVQYMTRESLIEYLHTHSNKSHNDLRKLIRFLDSEAFTKADLLEIDALLDKIKVCDPAVGSGAFPMGMLMEIFNLKAVINFELKNKEWDPVQVKKNIIYNSIYGVDLDEGAIEIARLRFWLSFIVDEKTPQALPNLDYKLMQGNSLVESFKGIDLSNLGRVDEMVLNEQTILNFDEEYTGVTVFDAVSLDKIRELITEYFDANNASTRNKKAIKKEIDDIIEGKIQARIYQEQELLKTLIQKFYSKYRLSENSDLKGLNKNSKDVKQFNEHKKRLADLAVYEEELINFQKQSERPYFLWNLFFSDVLENGGFDIVIGNPPYIKEYTNRKAFDEFRDMSQEYYQGKMDLWYGFACVGLDLLKEDGIECFIAQNNWITSAGASKLRDNVLKRTEIKQFLDFGNYKVFKSAGIQTMIYLLQNKKKPAESYEVKYAGLKESKVNNAELRQFLDHNIEKSKEKLFEKYIQKFVPEDFYGKYIAFIEPSVQSILKKIKKGENYKLNKKEVAQGIVAPQDKLNKSAVSKLSGNYKKNEGVFVLTDIEKRNTNFTENELSIIKPFYGTKQLGRFIKRKENKNWIIYAESDINSKIELFPNIKKHLDQFQKILTSSNKPYGLHRARDPYFFEGKKIMSLRKCGEPTFTYTDFSCYVSQSFFVIKSKDICLKYLTIFLNSKLVAFWLRYKGKMQGDNYQVDKAPLMKIPIYKPNSYFPFVELFELITASLTIKKKIIEVIENKHIAEFFEEVANACFFDVYFPEEMKEKDISVIEEISNKLKEFNINEDFGSLEEDIKREKIASLYSALKNSKAQQKMRRFITSSPDILKPILQN